MWCLLASHGSLPSPNLGYFSLFSYQDLGGSRAVLWSYRGPSTAESHSIVGVGEVVGEGHKIGGQGFFRKYLVSFLPASLPSLLSISPFIFPSLLHSIIEGLLSLGKGAGKRSTNSCLKGKILKVWCV